MTGLIRQSDYENYDYRQFWKDGKRLYEDGAERIAIKKFFRGISQENKVFADLGCGFGRLFEEYSGYGWIIMIDYSLNNLKTARKIILDFLKKEENSHLYCKVLFIAADINNLPLKPGILDACMTVRVVHHLSEPAIFFNEVSRVLKPESLFFLEFANKRNLKNILKFLAGKAAGSPFGREPLQVGDTILDYHPVYIKSLLKDLKFKVLKQLSVSNFRLGYLKKHVGLKTLLFFENLYQNLFSFADLGPSIFLKTEFVRQTGHESDKGNFSGSETGEISSESSSFRNISRGDLSLKDMLQCPGCSGDIFFSGGSLYDALALSGQTKMDDKKLKNAEILCSRCARKYPVKDGVMIFRELN